jgi:type 1 glutamine amidotransferase
MSGGIRRVRVLAWAAAVLSLAALVLAIPAVAADTVVPTIDVGALAGTADGNSNWRLTKPVTLNLTASDDVAVAKFQYSLDNGVTFVDVPVTAAPTAAAAIPITQEGNTTVRYRAVDSSGNYSAPQQATTLSVAAAAGATGVRLASTTGRIAGDVLVLDNGDIRETVTIASVVTPAPASPNPNVTLAAPLVNAHAAAAPVFQTWRTIGVLIDTFPPVATWAQVVDGKVLQSQTLTPTRTDPRRRDAADTGNGSGGTAVRGMELDGEYAYPFPQPLNRLAAGEHSQSVLMQDAAGNAIVYTQTFVVTSTFDDLDAVLTQYAANALNTTLSVPGTTTLNQPAAAGATGIRLQSTTGRVAGEVLAVDTGAGQELVTIASIPSPAPASPNPNVLLVAPLANAHAAGAAVSPLTAIGATGIRVGQPVGFRPGDTLLVDAGANQESVTIASVPSPVPGGTNPQLVLTAGLTKAHANGVAVSRPDPFVPAGVVANLRALLTQAENAAALGNVVGAVDLLHQFNTAVWQQVVPAGPKAAERAALTSASKAIANELLGGTTDTSGTGVTTSPANGAIRFFWNPTVPAPVPGATYKVLVNGKTGVGQFRHEAVVDIEAMIQKLGQDNGFDVDIWDPPGAGTSPGRAVPAGVSLTTSPFLDLATLKQYKTIVFDSTVGRNNASGVGATLSPAEFANLQAYIRDGGGFVAIHGATDAYQTDAANAAAPAWYTDLVGATFTNHGSNSAGGIQPDCGACGVVEIQNADPGHPATSHLPGSMPIIDELYNTNRNPVQLGIVHPLVLENEATLVGQFGYGTGTLMNGDHGMVWCRNFDGGRSFVSNLGHSPQLMLDPWYQQMILKGIQTTAGVVYGNCVTWFEVRSLIAADLAAGKINQAGANALNARLDDAEDAFDAGNITRSLNFLDTFVNVAKKPSTGDDKQARDELAFKGRELKDWIKNLD